MYVQAAALRTSSLFRPYRGNYRPGSINAPRIGRRRNQSQHVQRGVLQGLLEMNTVSE
jgi:hypothetical protein